MTGPFNKRRGRGRLLDTGVVIPALATGLLAQSARTAEQAAPKQGTPATRESNAEQLDLQDAERSIYRPSVTRRDFPTTMRMTSPPSLRCCVRIKNC